MVADGAGLVRNLVTDPYSVSLTTDSKRSYIADLASARLKPAGWDRHQAPAKVKAQTDMVVYELHVRDFSINDASVAPTKRGKYAAFGEANSNGMRHLAALSAAGMTDIHLLPVYDIATVPEQDCAVPLPAGRTGRRHAAGAGGGDGKDGLLQLGLRPLPLQRAGRQLRERSGRRRAPYHRVPPDGDEPAPRRPAGRHGRGLQPHLPGLSQHERAVLDRIVPGYYHRLDGGAWSNSRPAATTRRPKT
ncbi:hypothetical protein LP420_27985 [Massilia sp. B-10]|nr:hypothetical protein LP420_27985 [Massilia sp. B-10]